MTTGAETADHPSKIILLVHGAGERKRDRLLTTVVNAFANWMDRRGVPIDSPIKRPQVEVNWEGEGYSSIDLIFSGQRWRFKEVPWEGAGENPPFDPLIGWTFQRGLVQIRNLVGFLLTQALATFVLWVLLFIPVVLLSLMTLIISLGLRLFVSDAALEFFKVGTRVTLFIWLNKPSLFFVGGASYLVRNFDEHHLLEEIIVSIENSGIEWTTFLNWRFVLIVLLVGFHGLNSLANIGMYTMAMVMLVPMLFVFWLLAMFSDVPKFGDFTKFIKRRFESFLVGSLSDIKLFLDEPVQAERIRQTLEKVLDQSLKENQAPEQAGDQGRRK